MAALQQHYNDSKVVYEVGNGDTYTFHNPCVYFLPPIGRSRGERSLIMVIPSEEDPMVVADLLSKLIRERQETKQREQLERMVRPRTSDPAGCRDRDQL